MEQINNRSHQVTHNELEDIGCLTETLKKKVKKLEYKVYDISNLSDREKIALRVMVGMKEWQVKHNRGIKLRGDTKISLEIFNIKMQREELNKTIVQIDW